MSQVKRVPDGYATVTPMLSVNGAADLMAFYTKAFGAQERYRMPGPGGKVMHAEMQLGSSVIMMADAWRYPATQSYLHLYVEDVDAAWKRAVDAGAKVEMPLQDMPWGDRYGMLEDKWGNRITMASHMEDVSPEEIQARMAKMGG